MVDRIVQLEAHTYQLKNIIQKNLDTASSSRQELRDESGLKNSRRFDFSKSSRRHVLFKLYYLGWRYQGFATQEDSIDTIEYHLFNALQKTCLIESRQNSNYHRCGRTDKGVSAFSQGISIDVRSKFTAGEQMTEEAIKNELNYCQMLNRVLPADIRVVAWMPLDHPDYSARFDCYERTYRYFFPRGDLNVAAMQEACTYLMGIHDFRNLCKMDVGNGVTAFLREIRNAEIHLSSKDGLDGEHDPSFDVFYVELTGKAFLWHQVRCIVAVLVLIGQENEAPTVIRDLFDVETNPCKPQYSLANDLPLNLYDCKWRTFRSVEQCQLDQDENNESYDPFGLNEGEVELTHWVYDVENFGFIFNNLHQQWTLETVKASMIREMVMDLKRIYKNISPDEEKKNQAIVLLQGVRAKEYQKLLNRKKCKSLENRIEHYVKKRRLEIEDDAVLSTDS